MPADILGIRPELHGPGPQLKREKSPVLFLAKQNGSYHEISNT
jgi:hypothetical protein